MPLHGRKSQAEKFWCSSPTQSTLVLCCLVLFLAACRPNTAAAPPSPPLVVVTFTTSTTYESALRSIADLGLQLSLPCQGETVIDAQGQVQQWGIWRPLGQKEDFSQQSLWVAFTPIAPENWFARLQALPDVKQVAIPQGNIACPMTNTGSPPSPSHHFLSLLSANQAGAFSAVTFSATNADYSTELEGILNLGLRLADPCYEQAQAQGKSPAWHTMGQEQAFAATHQLIMATTTAASDQWQTQIQALPGLAAFKTPVTPACS